MGRRQKWQEILAIHEAEKDSFDNVNYATTMSLLGRIQSVNPEDPLFNQFLDNLGSELEVRGVTWMGARGIANIIDSIGRMDLKENESARRIALYIARKGNAEWLAKESFPEDVANTAWAFANMEIFWR